MPPDPCSGNLILFWETPFKKSWLCPWHPQQDIAGQRSEVLEQTTKNAEQSEIIYQLKEKLNEQDRQINLIQLQLEEAQFQVITEF